MLLPQVETQTQTASAQGVQQPFVEGDTLAEKRTIKCVAACPATVVWAACLPSLLPPMLSLAELPLHLHLQLWGSCCCTHHSSLPSSARREAYEDVLKERSGTAQDVSVVDEAQTPLGRCVGGGWQRTWPHLPNLPAWSMPSFRMDPAPPR